MVPAFGRRQAGVAFVHRNNGHCLQFFFLRGRLQELQSQGSDPAKGFDISFKVDVSQIMTPEEVKSLLSKLVLEG